MESTAPRPVVSLRLFASTDLDDLVRLANNPRIAHQLRDAFPHPYTREAGQGWLTFASRPDATVFAIEVEGQFAGGIGYHPGNDIERCAAEIGYWLGEPFWGRGVASVALIQLVEKVRRTGRFTRLFALPFADNLASQKVLNKAGFAFEALLRRAAIKNGTIRDLHLYGLVFGENEVPDSAT